MDSMVEVELNSTPIPFCALPFLVVIKITPLPPRERRPGPRLLRRRPFSRTISCSVPVARLTPAHEQMIKDALFDARDRLTLATRRL